MSQSTRHRVTKCGYRVDIHGYDGGMVYNEPERGTQVRDYGSYDIPYRSLLPQAVDNLLVAGRCLSASFEAQSSVRIQPNCRAMGQAAALAAAMSLRQGITPRALDGVALREALRARGANL